MANIKDERMKELLRKLASEFLNRESTRTALLTVSNIDLSPDLKNAKIFLSVLPREKEYGAVDFANRHRKELSDYIKSHSKIYFLPRITFLPDIGEQNRQRISELLETE